MITVEGMLISARWALDDPSAQGVLAPMFLAQSPGDAIAFQRWIARSSCDDCGIVVCSGLDENYGLLVNYYGDCGDILSSLTRCSHDLQVNFWVVWPEDDTLRAAAAIGPSKHVDVTIRVTGPAPPNDASSTDRP